MRPRVFKTWLISSVLIAAVSSTGLLGQGTTQPRDPVAPRETAVSNGALTGRIVRASDGTPLGRVEVRAEPTSGSEPRIALTGFDGRFQMTDMPAGQWMLTMSKSGYLRMKSGQRTPTQSAKAVRISPGETTSFDAAMIPGAAITGYVVDELGDPVAGVAVEALRPRSVDGPRRLTAVARDLTDDTGAYRLHSLTRGEYFVSARLRVGSPDESSGPTAALPTFFPGTTSLTEAGRISLRAGEERSGVGFAVSTARAVRVSGTVIDSAGRGVDEAAVELFDPANGTVIGRPFGNFGLTQGGGRFGILNIAPGRYALSARIDREDRRGVEVAIIPLTVGPFDVEVGITTRPAAVLSGTVVAGPGATLPRQFQASIWALPTGEVGRRIGVTVAPDRSFELSGFSGPTRIWVGDLPRGWAVSRIEINGTNVTDETFELRAGVDANMRVVVTNQLGSVRGSVTAGNVPAGDVAVLVFTTDTQQWSMPSRFVKSSRTDVKGQFSVDGLPPGEYRAVALDDFTDDEPLDAEVLGRVRDVAMPFTVTLAAPASVNLSMTER